MSKKNRCLALAGASQGGEPHREIPHDPPSFSLAALRTDVFLLQGKKFIFYMDILVVGYRNYISFFIL